jgi:hypothetical protein
MGPGHEPAEPAGAAQPSPQDPEIPMDDPRTMLRHLLAVIAYRASKSVRGAPAGFATFRASTTTRTPAEILAHMGDLMDWGLAMTREKHRWHDSTPLEWDAEVARFFAAITAWDDYLASGAPIVATYGKLLAGPVADSLNHVGQLNLLRRMAGSPVRGESYAMADIRVGRTGLEQPPANPKYEFD